MTAPNDSISVISRRAFPRFPYSIHAKRKIVVKLLFDVWCCVNNSSMPPPLERTAWQLQARVLPGHLMRYHTSWVNIIEWDVNGAKMLNQ